MLPPDKNAQTKACNPRPFNTKDNTEALIIQERSTFAHRHLARHTHCETIQEKIERNLAPFPCTLRTPRKSTVSDKERKSFYVTDDISFGFMYPYREVAASMIPSEKQCQPKHRRKNIQCALKIKPSLWIGTPSPIIKTEGISISGVAPSLSQGICLFRRRIYTEDSMRRGCRNRRNRCPRC